MSIVTCDNPGWWVRIQLNGTPLAQKPFRPIEHNVSLAQMERIAGGLELDLCDRGDDWMLCQVKNQVFDGAGGPRKLDEILVAFLEWAEEK